MESRDCWKMRDVRCFESARIWGETRLPFIALLDETGRFVVVIQTRCDFGLSSCSLDPRAWIPMNDFRGLVRVFGFSSYSTLKMGVISYYVLTSASPIT